MPQRGSGGCRGPAQVPPPCPVFTAGVVGGASNNNGLWLAAGSNISLVTSSGPQGLSVWINAIGGIGPGPGGSSSWGPGMGGPTLTDNLSIVAGNYIYLQP